MSVAQYLLAFVLLGGLYWMQSSKLPPGPRGLPIFGNIHQVSRTFSWKQFQQWHKVYGPVIALKLGQITVILMGNHAVTKELFGRRSAIYSSRPRLTVVRDCVGKDYVTALMPYGPSWKLLHKIQMSFLNTRKCQLYQPLQEYESCHVLFNLLSCNDFEAELYRYTSSLMFSLLYGRRFSTGNEPDLKQTEQLATTVLEAVSSGNWIVDIFPVFNCLPRFLAKWKRVGDDLHSRPDQLYEKNSTDAMGRDVWNWTKQSLLVDEPTISRKGLNFLLGEMYETASHTTAGALVVAVLACVTYPAAMRNVQNELDSCVGIERLPDFEDIQHLPYTRAFVQEVLRWRPLAPGGLPYSPLKDDYYEGFLIPKGTTVIATHWCLEMDRDVFHDPEEFIPERWLENANLPMTAFGFGRRACPGQHLAKDTISLVVSQLFWAFDIKWKGGQGREPGSVGMTHEGVFSKPSSFQATFTARSSLHEKVIRTKRAAQRDGLDKILDVIGEKFAQVKTRSREEPRQPGATP